MEFKILEEKDIDLMKDFIDDENTKYEKEILIKFINDNHSYGFIAKNKNKIIGFAYGYTLIRPDGKLDFYIHAIDIMVEFQGNGYGTQLMNYIKEYIKQSWGSKSRKKYANFYYIKKIRLSTYMF